MFAVEYLASEPFLHLIRVVTYLIPSPVYSIEMEDKGSQSPVKNTTYFSGTKPGILFLGCDRIIMRADLDYQPTEYLFAMLKIGGAGEPS